MKVAYVVGGLPFGGIETLLFDMSLELKKRGFEFIIINLSGTGNKLPEFLNAEIPVINLNDNLKSIKTYRLDTSLKLRKFLKEYSPDIVHSMQFSADYFSRISSLFLPAKIVAHIHNVKQEKTRKENSKQILSLKTDVFISVSKEVFKLVEKTHNIF